MAQDGTRLRHFWRGPHYVPYDPDLRGPNSADSDDWGSHFTEEAAHHLYFRRDLLHGPPYRRMGWEPYDDDHWTRSPYDEFTCPDWLAPQFFPEATLQLARPERALGRPERVHDAVRGLLDPLVDDHTPHVTVTPFGRLHIPEFEGWGRPAHVTPAERAHRVWRRERQERQHEARRARDNDRSAQEDGENPAPVHRMWERDRTDPSSPSEEDLQHSSDFPLHQPPGMNWDPNRRTLRFTGTRRVPIPTRQGWRGTVTYHSPGRTPATHPQRWAGRMDEVTVSALSRRLTQASSWKHHCPETVGRFHAAGFLSVATPAGPHLVYLGPTFRRHEFFLTVEDLGRDPPHGGRWRRPCGTPAWYTAQCT